MYVPVPYVPYGTHTLTSKDINQKRPFFQLPYQKNGLVFFNFQLENNAKTITYRYPTAEQVIFTASTMTEEVFNPGS
jgi:hypothetical protein